MPFFRRLPLWSLAAAVIALIVAVPVITLLTHALGGSTEHWSHLFQFVLPQAEQYLAAALGSRCGGELFGSRFSLADYRLRVSRTTNLAMGFVVAAGRANLYRGLCVSGFAASDWPDSVCHSLCVGL